MPWKDIDKQREAIRKHYYANRQSYIDKANKKRLELRKWVYQQKQNKPCTDCKQSFPYYVMDFDHLSNKTNTISRLINTGSRKQVEAEIAKCELVCSNCHRIRTYTRSPSKISYT